MLLQGQWDKGIGLLFHGLIMNKDITTSTQRGYYIVYLFSEDMERLYLTLAQGVTETTKEEMQKLKKRFVNTYICPKR